MQPLSAAEQQAYDLWFQLADQDRDGRCSASSLLSLFPALMATPDGPQAWSLHRRPPSSPTLAWLAPYCRSSLRIGPADESAACRCWHRSGSSPPSPMASPGPPS